jgi:hypothetical protein
MERLLIHIRLNALVVISWVIFLKATGIGRKIQGEGNNMPRLSRMVNPNENKKVILMKNKIENNITRFLPYPVQCSRGQKIG